MKPLESWQNYLDLCGVSWIPLESNKNAIQLTSMAGAPILRIVKDREELDSLHTTARQKSSELNRLLILALPFDHPFTQLSLPGDIVLPRVRVYAGHASDTFSLSGHLVQSKFLTSIKAEVSKVIGDGTKVDTPLCDWAIKLLGKSWIYGKPSSPQQLDSMLGLFAQDPSLVGHVRSRQLSYGRGCGDALLLPIKGVQLKNNQLDQKIEQADLRFISLEAEMAQYDSARARIHAVLSDRYLTVASQASRKVAIELGCGSAVGASKIGSVTEKPKKVQAQSEVSKELHVLV